MKLSLAKTDPSTSMSRIEPDPQPAGSISQRIFCLGINKTGTSSIKHCFRLLKISPIASPSTYTPDERALIRQFYKHKNYSAMLELAEHFMAFEDRPWNMWSMYRHLDNQFPDSRFILTIRDEEAWWRSTEQWITVTKPAVLERYQLHLRVQQPNKESMIESYLRYNQEVEDYFAGSGKLLVMNLPEGDGWEKLCPFLDLPEPEETFPHANRQKYSKSDAQALKQKRRLKHGVECQSCHHVNIVKQPRLQKGKHSGQRLSLKRARWHLRPENLQNSLTARRILHGSYRIMRNFRRPGDRLRSATRNLPALPQGELGVVACFFNPGGSQRRVSNFRRFLAAMDESDVPCRVVELAFGSNAHEFSDYPNSIMLRSESIMWHKERLLNIGIRQLLAEGFRKIAWLDGDIRFHDSRWPQEISDRLESARLCQIFEAVKIHAQPSGPPMVAPSSVKYFRESGRIYPQPPTRSGNLLRGMLKGGQSGFGWAARAEVLNEVLLYEHAIVGGGDKLIMAASLDDGDTGSKIGELTHSKYRCKACGHTNRSEAFTADYLAWASRWTGAVARKVDYARLEISDMYHGMRSDRGYMTRHDILYRNEFDPVQDLETDASGCLKWSSGKASLHNEIEAYFLSRREDV